MANSIEKAILHAAEAAMAHMVMISKSVNSKLISEGTLYETIAHTIRGRGVGWVNHEHIVSFPGKVKRQGDHKRVDFGIKYKGKVTLLEVTVASRTKILKEVKVDTDIEKLALSQPLIKGKETFARNAYLIVLNMHTHDVSMEVDGEILWYTTVEERRVKFLKSFIYRSENFVRTASVFRIQR